jgi:hypothetical protein
MTIKIDAREKVIEYFVLFLKKDEGPHKKAN